MKRALDQLAYSIAETGKWTWWAAKLPLAIQLEFDQTHLHFGGREFPLTPSSKIALAFYKPTAISFIQKGMVEKNWEVKLGADMIDSFAMNADQIAFNNPKLFRKMLFEAHRTKLLFGGEPMSKAFREAKIQFGFWAGNVGIVLAAESMRIFNIDGEIALDDITYYAEQWKTACLVG